MEAAVSPALWVLDLLLCCALAVLAVRALVAEDLFESVLDFVVFGLLMALTWTRLGAPDVALAEAALGAGLTGAMFLATLAELSRSRPVTAASKAGVPAPATPGARVHSWLLPGLTGLVVTVLAGAALAVPPEVSGLRDALRARADTVEIGNLVTVVLLDVRAYDTLLEMVVLLLAVMSGRALADPGERAPPAGGESRILVWFVRAIAPVIVVVAGSLLWAGTTRPGGAFQAGAVLAALGLLLGLSAQGRQVPWLYRPGGVPLSLGVLVFLAVGVAPWLTGGSFLEHAPGAAAARILLIEVACAVSVASSLAELCRGPRESGRSGGGARDDEVAPWSP